ncbi:MAG TPA: hypothetical protein DEP72_06800 [Clostridiales bacterium]|nr:MAG: hypothetical protein A2Y18_06190 [Clostridiales bacterium GWD2_32_19]HCC07848.1 hypothetical protein [Clostridiales bacterium]
MKNVIRGVYVALILLIIMYSNSVYTYAMSLEYDGEKHEYTAKPIKLMVNGKQVDTEMPPIILNDRTLVPARDVFEKLGAKVKWDEKYKQVYIIYGSKTIILTINNKTAYINQITSELDVPAKLINGKTMIPVAFVAKGLGFKVNWVEKTRIVEVNETATSGSIKTDTTSEEILKAHDIAKTTLEWKNDKDIETYKNFSISKRDYSDVNIDDVSLIKVDNENIDLVITASDRVSNITHSRIDNKLIIDIDNSIMEFNANKYTIIDNLFIKGITTTQVSKEPNKSKIVFELKDNYNYEVSLSGNRKNIVVRFLKNQIYAMQLSEKSETATLYIKGSLKTNVTAFRLTDPDRIVFDVPYSYSKLDSKQASVTSKYIKSIRTSQFEESTTRFVIDTIGQPKYDIEFRDNIVKIKITEAEYKNITYDNEDEKNTKIILIKPKDKIIDISQIKVVDNYLQKNLQITFPGDFTSEFGNGEININDERISKVNVSKRGSNTAIDIYSNTIFACNINEDEKYIYVELLKPKQKYSKIVLIDAGHGGSDPGATVSGIFEKNINLVITTKIEELIEADGNIKVYVTRDKDNYPTLQDRAKIAEDVQADVFVSVHNNATLSEKAIGTETLYFPLSTKNASGLDAKILAEIVQSTVANELGSKDRGVIARSDLYVLKNTTMPAIIVEIGYMTNPTELANLKNISYTDNAANGIFKAIKKIFKQYEPKRN